MEGIILIGAEHKYIFDSRNTRTTRFLIKQLLDFYIRDKQLNPKGEGCCLNLDESSQKAKNEADEQEI